MSATEPIDEQGAAEPEEELLVACLEADEDGTRETERDAREGEHVRGQLRLRDPAHGALQDLARRLRVLLLDAIELVDASRLGGRLLVGHARCSRSAWTRRSAQPVASASAKPATTSSQ